MRSLRNTERVLTNSVAKKVLEVEAKGDATIEDIASHVAGGRGRRLLEEGDMEAGVMAAGQIVGLIRDIPSVQELMDRIIREAVETAADRFGPVLRARGGAA
jgi:nitronate monooxygenase